MARGSTVLSPSVVHNYDLSLDAMLLEQRSEAGSAVDYRNGQQYPPEDDQDDDDDDWFSSCDGNDFELARFRQLRDALGSEVLQAELQAQIDRGADAFIHEHVRDATALEKIAMSSVTSQLPQRAVQALATSAKSRRPENQTGHKPRTLSTGGSGVSREEEILLARLIQQGATLFRVREKLLSTLGRPPTRQEWADKAMITTKELRRHVSSYRSAKHMLVEANMGLVHAVVNQQVHILKHGITKAELIQEGSLGLMRAAELFDPSRGLRFSTYAVVWIKGTLFNSHLSEFVRLPQREKAKYNKILKAQRDMDSDVAAVPSSQSPERVAQATGLSVEEVVTTQERMHQAQRLMSLDYEYATLSRSGADSSKMSMLEKNPSLQADVDLSERTQLQADVLAALARNLDAREARLMRLRYGLSDGHARSLHECADAMGLSYTRVHQLANKCLEKLRRASEVEALEEYLLTIA
jgi:RNA polymerase nonessential primary-like sigma factor